MQMSPTVGGARSGMSVSKDNVVKHYSHRLFRLLISEGAALCLLGQCDYTYIAVSPAD